MKRNQVVIHTRQLPQEEATTEFTTADLRTLGELSVKLGQLHWQTEEVGDWENQVAILLKQQTRLNDLVALILMRQL